MQSIAKVTVDVVSDIMCPWCLVGMLKLERARDMLAGELEINIRWRPFELNPDLPPEGQDWAQGILAKYGRLPDPGPQPSQVVAMELGYDMSWPGLGDEPPRWTWNTHNAHKLMSWTLEHHGPAIQNKLARALFDAHFRERQNMADPAVLAAIAENVGIDGAEALGAINNAAMSNKVFSEEFAAQQAGINSVPTFILNDHFSLQGSQEPDVLVHHLRRVAAEAPIGSQ